MQAVYVGCVAGCCELSPASATDIRGEEVSVAKPD